MKSRTILFPGLAADYRVFNGMDGYESYTYINYLELDFTIQEDELIEYITKKYSITSQDRLIATSFGGLLATRIAIKKSIDDVVLIGAVVNKEEIRIPFKLLLFARFFLKFHISLIPKWILMPIFGLMTSEDCSTFITMSRVYSIHQIYSMVNFINKIRPAFAVTKCIRIHGKYDRLVMPKNADKWEDEGHILTMKGNKSIKNTHGLTNVGPDSAVVS